MDMRFISLLVVLTVHCDCVNIGKGLLYKLTLPNNVKVKYNDFCGWLYIPKEGEQLNDIYQGGRYTAKECLKICRQTPNCIAVNYCYYKNNCHLDGDSANVAQHTQATTNSRCILLSAGLVPWENPDDRALQNDQWTHFYPQISVSDYDVDQE